MHPVFSREISKDFEYARQQTPEYEFLNRCPRAEVENVRLLIEEWFSRIPADERPRMLSSLKSHDNQEHFSAFFELYCHELLLRNDMTVMMHSIGSLGRAKDFRAERNGVTIEMEAVLCMDSDTKRTEKAILNVVTDYIDISAFVPGFRYELDVRQRAIDLPPLKSLVAEIRDWASSHHRAQIRELLETSGYERLPSQTFIGGEWVLDVRLIPRPSDEEESEDFRNAIGVGPLEAGEIQNEKALWNTLKRKARHYSDHNYPFVIAVDAMLQFPMHDEIDVMQALFGTEALVYNPTTGQTRMTRDRDGIWIGPKGPRNRHVSGVLLVNQLRSSSVSSAGIQLYLNPWATKPIEPGRIEVPTSIWELKSGLRSDFPGKQPWQTFDLSKDWPFG
jgi:hypothetical protein